MGESTLVKEARHKRAQAFWFHLWEVPADTKLITGGKKLEQQLLMGRAKGLVKRTFFEVTEMLSVLIGMWILF